MLTKKDLEQIDRLIVKKSDLINRRIDAALAGIGADGTRLDKHDEALKIIDDAIREQDRQIGVYIEHSNDQLQRIIEAFQLFVERRTADIPKILQKLDKMNGRIAQNTLNISKHDKRLNKIESKP